MRTFLGLLILVITSPGAAQTPYLPLEIGNEWTYGYVVHPADAPPDTIGIQSYVIEATIEYDGITYFQYYYPFALEGDVRIDDDGTVWQRQGEAEVVLFDFSLADGESYAYSHPDHDVDYEVTVDWSESCKGVSTEFEDCVTFSFDDPVFIDEERFYTFARDIGLVSASAEVGDWRGLMSGRIGGELVPTAIIPQERYVFSTQIFPNPAQGAATVRVALGDDLPVTVSIYDALGRRVTTLADRRFAHGPHQMHWQAHQHAPGVYFVVIETPRDRSTRSLILTQ